MFQPGDKNFIRNVGVAWIVLYILFLFMFSATTHAAEYRLLNAEKLEIDYSKLDSNNRDPYAMHYTGKWKDRAALKLRVGVLESLYWDNNIHVESINTDTVKTVGWEWEVGLRVSKYFTLFQHHHSKHIMDETSQLPSNRSNKFPVEDSYGIKFIIVEETQGRSIFK